MIYFIISIIVFFVGLIPFAKYFFEHEKDFLKDDIISYITIILVWSAVSLCFPLVLFVILLKQICNKKYCK